ncbi:MAG: hypothetical protein GHCLOJNM_01327 [bacterium]|nr:hypothetical protein [bacterium]
MGFFMVTPVHLSGELARALLTDAGFGFDPP